MRTTPQALMERLTFTVGLRSSKLGLSHNFLAHELGEERLRLLVGPSLMSPRFVLNYSVEMVADDDGFLFPTGRVWLV